MRCLSISRHPKPIITPELIAQCCIQTGMTVDVDYIQQFVMAGYKILDEDDSFSYTCLETAIIQTSSEQSECLI